MIKIASKMAENTACTRKIKKSEVVY